MILRIALLTGEELRIPQTVANLRNPHIAEVIRMLNTSLFFPRGEKCYKVLDAETGVEITAPEQWEDVKAAARRAASNASGAPPSDVFSTTQSRQPAVAVSPQFVALTMQLGGPPSAASHIAVGERKWVQATPRRRQSVSPSNRTSGSSSSGNGRCISPLQGENIHSERLCEYSTNILRLALPPLITSAESPNNSMVGLVDAANGVLVTSPLLDLGKRHSSSAFRSSPTGRPTSPGSFVATTSPKSSGGKKFQSHNTHWLHQQHQHHHHHHHMLAHHHHQHHVIAVHHMVVAPQPQLDISPPASATTTKSKRTMHATGEGIDEDDCHGPPPPSLDTQPPMAVFLPIATGAGVSPQRSATVSPVNKGPSITASSCHQDGHPTNASSSNGGAIIHSSNIRAADDTNNLTTQKPLASIISVPAGVTLEKHVKHQPQPVQYFHHHHHHLHHHHHHAHAHAHHQHHFPHPLQLTRSNSGKGPQFGNGSGVFSNYNPFTPAVVAQQQPQQQLTPPMHRSAVSLVNAIARDRGAALIDRISDILEEREFVIEEEKRTSAGGMGVGKLMGGDNSNMIITTSTAPPRKSMTTATPSAAASFDQAMLNPLIEMGFSPAASRYALRKVGGKNAEQAIEMLLQFTGLEIERIEAKEKLIMEKEDKAQQQQQQQQQLATIAQQQQQLQQELEQKQQLQLAAAQCYVNTPHLTLKQLLTQEELQRRQHVSKLIDMGFTGQSSRDALRRADGDFDTACVFLLEDSTRPGGHDHSTTNATSGSQPSSLLATHSSSNSAPWYEPIEGFVRRHEVAAENVITVVRFINDSPQHAFLVWHCATLGFTMSKMASVFTGGAPTTISSSAMAASVTPTTATASSAYSTVGPHSVASAASSAC